MAADEVTLKKLSKLEALHIKGWFRVVYTDATIAMLIGIIVTVSFLIAGADVLGPQHLAPREPDVAITLSTLFSSHWGKFSGILFMIGGAAALISTQIGQLAGWPRLLADSFRICLPGFKERFVWKTQLLNFACF
ncbi:hypothetical protein JW960_18410 [candidate division KSB1 bacterium]|nr:hypothetical protein [candidate division KSB1 bacterium]